MQLSYILASIALFATAASAAPYESDADAHAIVRSLIVDDPRVIARSLMEEYEEFTLSARQCKVGGAQCTGNVKTACAALCIGPPCGFNRNTPAKEALNICLQKCTCSGSASSGGGGIKVDNKKKVKV
ncbi:hypothetical protein BKA70DRAFT_1569807 [Coprinopsis sp. MPI-PUGE-AT-0042]|nr:hypothetical protein BKA70DRAFT_1569807 [Coprinopsis sp. MPI-PUGE-AT-0042]